MQQTPQPGRVLNNQRLGGKDYVYVTEKQITSVDVPQSAYCLERALIPIQLTSHTNGFSTILKARNSAFSFYENEIFTSCKSGICASESCSACLLKDYTVFTA